MTPSRTIIPARTVPGLRDDISNAFNEGQPRTPEQNLALANATLRMDTNKGPVIAAIACLRAHAGKRVLVHTEYARPAAAILAALQALDVPAAAFGVLNLSDTLDRYAPGKASVLVTTRTTGYRAADTGVIVNTCLKPGSPDFLQLLDRCPAVPEEIIHVVGDNHVDQARFAAVLPPPRDTA